MDGTGLRAGERFKCAKCKKLMRFGPHLFDPATRSNWQMGRMVLVVACIAATVPYVTVGYSIGSQQGGAAWVAGFGGSLLVWLVAVGCIALAAWTTQSNGVLIGVTATMAGVALFFIERLAEKVDSNVVEGWRREFQFYDLWKPGLIVGGLALLVVSLVIQARARSV
jgi:hypothetical protein